MLASNPVSTLNRTFIPLPPHKRVNLRLACSKTTFNSNLRLALAVYREAKVEGAQDGLTLHPSPPPIAPRIVAVRSLAKG
jgi:hypothetical protein